MSSVWPGGGYWPAFSACHGCTQPWMQTGHGSHSWTGLPLVLFTLWCWTRVQTHWQDSWAGSTLMPKHSQWGLSLLKGISNSLLSSAKVFLTIFSALQGRSPTNARYVAKPSARAPTSSLTAASTQASSPSAASSVPRASSAKWIYGGTERPNTVSSEGQLQVFSGAPTASACSREEDSPQHLHPACGCPPHKAHIASYVPLGTGIVMLLALVFRHFRALHIPVDDKEICGSSHFSITAGTSPDLTSPAQVQIQRNSSKITITLDLHRVQNPVHQTDQQQGGNSWANGSNNLCQASAVTMFCFDG